MRTAILGAAWLMFAFCAAAQSPPPFARAHFEPADHVAVGQPVRLVVEVLVPNYFMGGSSFPEIEIKNAIVVAPQETPQNFSEQVQGNMFAGIRQTYTVYPETAGTFRVLAALVGVTYADAPPHSIRANVGLPPLEFHAAIPSGAAGLSYFLPTTKAVMTQEWKPRPKNARTGETLERTITITTEKLQGMLIPPISFDAPDGVRVYAEQPVVQDEKSDRGEFIGGRRVETAKYLIEKPGNYTLPAVELQWWDLAAGRVRTETLPAMRFTAVADPAYTPELPPTVEPDAVAQKPAAASWRHYWLLLRANWIWFAGGVLLLWLVVRTIPRFVRWIGHERETLRASEGAYFRKLTTQCNRSDAANAYVWLLRWLERSQPGNNLEDSLRETSDPELRNLVDELGAALYSSATSSTWNGAALALALKRHRKVLRARANGAYALPPLNPQTVAAVTNHKA
jgi:hypothetical protein